LPLQRSEKETIVGAVSARLKEAEVVVLTDYRGLTTAQVNKLRRNLRDSGAEFRIVKNTLMLRAFEAAGITPPAELLVGPTALALLFEDLSGPAQALRECATETELLAIKGGLMSGKLIDAATVKALADLPSRDELLAQVLGVFAAPLQQYVTVLSAPLRDFVRVLNAHAEPAAGAEG